MKILFLALSLFTINLIASDLKHAPNSFIYNGQKAVFVDFLKATYNLTYDAKAKKAEVETTIHFFTKEDGMPIFDSVHSPHLVWLDETEVESKLISVPGLVSKVRLALSKVSKGIHTIKIRTSLEDGTKYGYKGVSSGFFIKDLKDRNFLEKYIPSNYEYDHYAMTFNVSVINAENRWHDIFANGEVNNYSQNNFTVKFPDHYTASSVFFHLVPRRKFWRYYLTYKSINGRRFPITIYSSFKWLNRMLKRKTFKVLYELEKDYGPYPHPSLVIYGPSKLRGGMEYVGATATSVVSLGHELHHMWFAKGAMPADGNSGWIDEGLASWRDKGYQTASSPDYFSANLARHNTYTRKTDKRSYEYGRSFFAYIDYQLKAAGVSGLKSFLKFWSAKKMFSSFTTEDFIQELETFSSLNFRADFNQYIYGGHTQFKTQESSLEIENEHHPEYTQEELDEII